MSELEYRAAKDAVAKLEVLHRLKGVVLETAAFLADFPERRLSTGTKGRYLDLGPPLVSASEGEGPYDVWNPTYELTQFNFSLDLAGSWLERLGLPRNETWEHVRMNLAPLPIVTLPNGMKTYNRHQNCLPTVFSHNGTQHCSGPNSHPALNGALGCLPAGYGVDADIMNNTLHETLQVWEWNNCWGWDQPMVAMTATRLNQPQVALSTLLMVRVCFQEPSHPPLPYRARVVRLHCSCCGRGSSCGCLLRRLLLLLLLLHESVAVPNGIDTLRIYITEFLDQCLRADRLQPPKACRLG